MVDLRTDLVVASPEVVTPSRLCKYTTPCAIGAMLLPDERQALFLAGKDTVQVGELLFQGTLSAPRDQWDDLAALQQAFDSGDKAAYAALHAQLMEKYA